MKSHLLIGLSAVCFAIIGVLIKIIGNEIPVMTLVFLRCFIALVFLAVVLPFFDKKTFSINKKDAKEFFVVGLLMTLAFSSFVAANLFAPVQHVVLINKISPFFVLIFAYFMLKEKITKTKITALVIAFIGLIVINPLNAGNYFFGNVLAMGSAGAGALMVCTMRKEDKNHGIGDVFWFFLFATILLLPAPFIFGLGNVQKVIVPLLLFGVVGTGLAYLLYNLGLKKMEVEEASILSMIVTPLFSIQLAVMLLGEPLEPHILLGGAILIGAGISLELHRKHLKEIKQAIERKIENAEYGAAVIEVKAKREVFGVENAIEDKLNPKKSD